MYVNNSERRVNVNGPVRPVLEFLLKNKIISLGVIAALFGAGAVQAQDPSIEGVWTPEPAQPAVEAEVLQRLNLRDDASANSPIVGALSRGENVIVVDVEDPEGSNVDFVQVLRRGDEELDDVYAAKSANGHDYLEMGEPVILENGGDDGDEPPAPTEPANEEEPPIVPAEEPPVTGGTEEGEDDGEDLEIRVTEPAPTAPEYVATGTPESIRNSDDWTYNPMTFAYETIDEEGRVLRFRPGMGVEEEDGIVTETFRFEGEHEGSRWVVVVEQSIDADSIVNLDERLTTPEGIQAMSDALEGAFPMLKQGGTIYIQILPEDYTSTRGEYPEGIQLTPHTRDMYAIERTELQVNSGDFLIRMSLGEDWGSRDRASLFTDALMIALYEAQINNPPASPTSGADAMDYIGGNDFWMDLYEAIDSEPFAPFVLQESAE